MDYRVFMANSIYFNDPRPSRTIKVKINIESNEVVLDTPLFNETQTNGT